MYNLQNGKNLILTLHTPLKGKIIISLELTATFFRSVFSIISCKKEIFEVRARWAPPSMPVIDITGAKPA